jgi:hypothetical protein
MDGSSPHSWESWKKRIARMVVFGGLALLASQLLPVLPSEQRIEVRAPGEYQIVSLDLAYLESESEVPLVTTQIRPLPPTQSIRHSVSLRPGKYRLNTLVALIGVSGLRYSVEQNSEVSLSGALQVVHLPEPLDASRQTSAK